jgi:hypothetical protein
MMYPPFIIRRKKGKLYRNSLPGNSMVRWGKERVPQGEDGKVWGDGAV